MTPETRISQVRFVTFASSNAMRALRRIRRQAVAFGFLPSYINAFTERDLDPSFLSKMGWRMRKGVRGYGYWCWKPQVVLQVLNQIPEGCVVLYADAGCHLNPQGRIRFCEYLDLMEKTDMLVFQSRIPSAGPRTELEYHYLPEGQWCKGDLLDFFGVRENGNVVRTGQIGSGIFLIRKTARTMEFFRRFAAVFLDHYELADDSPSGTPNLPGFRENRHDQSIFSVMCKLAGYDLCSLSSCEYVPYTAWLPAKYRTGTCRTWDEMMRCPILAKRAYPTAGGHGFRCGLSACGFIFLIV